MQTCYIVVMFDHRRKFSEKAEKFDFKLSYFVSIYKTFYKLFETTLHMFIYLYTRTLHAIVVQHATDRY